MSRTRVLIADSFPMGVRRLLSANTDFDVVEASDLASVLNRVAEVCPDIAPIGLDLRPNGGLEAVALLPERCSCHSIVWSCDVATQLILALHGREHRRDVLERAAVLSVRERQVLDLVARGARNRQIAEALVISAFTVKRHMQNILRKLGLPSRGAAASFYTAAFAPGSDAVTSSAGGAA